MRIPGSALLLCGVLGYAPGLEAQERVSFATEDGGVVSADLWGRGSDLRGRGESRAGTMGPDALALDVVAAVRYLRETGTDRVAVVGASLGGWAAAEAVVSAEPGEIDSVVLLAHSPIDQPERLTGRKLFLHTDGCVARTQVKPSVYHLPIGPGPDGSRTD